MTSSLRTAARLTLGGAVLLARVSHLTFVRTGFGER